MLEEKLKEAHTEVRKNESEVGELKAQVAMFKAQLSHVQSPKISHQPTSDKVRHL